MVMSITGAVIWQNQSINLQQIIKSEEGILLVKLLLDVESVKYNNVSIINKPFGWSCDMEFCMCLCLGLEVKIKKQCWLYNVNFIGLSGL